MHTLRHYIILIVLFMTATPALAQVQDVAAANYYKALQFKLKRKHEQAYEAMKIAIRQNPSFADAYSTLGAWYFTDRKYKEAIEVFSNASRNCKNGASAFALPLARCLLYDNRPGPAMQLIVANSNAVKSNPEWDVLRRQAAFMQKALARPLRDSVINLGTRVNTKYAEMHPFISADTQTLYYNRLINNVDMDCYRTKADSCGGWFSGGNLGAPTNTIQHEAAQSVSADGHYLFYMRCGNHSDNGWDQGGCDLFMAYAADTVWSIGQSFGATINTVNYEGMPCLSPDNRDLYYVSDREGGYGGLDIWVSRFENGLWQQPRNLGPAINTPGNEISPFIHIDNSTLYFSSTGHDGMGGADLYYARRINDTTWSAPVSMGYPINTSANEASMSITIDGKKAFLSSDRDSVMGNYDLYETYLPEHLKPAPVVVVKGYVYDSLEKSRLNNAPIVITDEYTGERLYRYVSNRGDGSFMMTLPAGNRYRYTADRIGYIEKEDTLHTIIDGPSNTIERNISLLPQGYTAPIFDSIILTINFPINSAHLTDADKAAIRDAMQPWIDEKGVVLFVNGYTDNTGTPLLNEQLSAARARLVADEIMSYGVSEFNMTTQGWGEAAPVAANDTEIGRDMNRRVEVVIRR